jgi:hypothetical protein
MRKKPQEQSQLNNNISRLLKEKRFGKRKKTTKKKSDTIPAKPIHFMKNK